MRRFESVSTSLTVFQCSCVLAIPRPSPWALLEKSHCSRPYVSSWLAARLSRQTARRVPIVNAAFWLGPQTPDGAINRAHS